MDFVLALFATVLIWHLQIKKREKLGVLLVRLFCPYFVPSDPAPLRPDPMTFSC